MSSSSNSSSSSNNNSSSNEENQSSSLSSWWSWFIQFQDEQRLDRLQKCRDIQQLLEACQKHRQDPQNYTSYDPTAIESFPGGLRVMKYFGWRGILKPFEAQKEDAEAGWKAQVSQSCLREEHALWACRAVAVGCGKELGLVKAALEEQGVQQSLVVGPESSSSCATFYESEKKKNNHHHHHDHQTKIQTRNEHEEHEETAAVVTQRLLGSCVQREANALLERMEQRKSKGHSSKD